MTSTAEQLDATRALVDQWREGDTAARDVLLQRVHPIMRRWARAIVVRTLITRRNRRWVDRGSGVLFRATRALASPARDAAP